MDTIHEDISTDFVYHIKAGLLLNTHVQFVKQRQNYVEAHPQVFS